MNNKIIRLPFKKCKPYPHQEFAVKFAQEVGNIGLLWDMGAGKTRGMIDIMRMLGTKAGRMLRTLIITPPATLNNWKEEIAMHSNFPIHAVLIVSGDKKHEVLVKALTFDSAILITNYETMINKDLKALIKEFRPEVMVLDEAHYIKTHNAKRTKEILELGLNVQHKYILTGTPITNNIDDIFTLMQFLDNGEALTTNYYAFKSLYMVDKNAWMKARAGMKHFPKYVPCPEMFGILTAKIAKRCLRVLKKDVMKDLPPRIEVVKEVGLAPVQKKIYEDMKRDFIAFVEDAQNGNKYAVIAQVAMVKALRLMQICSGHVKDDQEAIHEVPTGKPALLKELLEEIVIGGNNKCIIWHHFRHDVKIISKVCSDLGIKYVSMGGGMSVNERTQAMDAFNKGSAMVFIGQRQSAGIGINLVPANYSIGYSRDFSLSTELQSRDRNYRGGSQIHDHITKIDLVTAGTIEVDVVKALQNKEELGKKIIDIIKGERR